MLNWAHEMKKIKILLNKKGGAEAAGRALMLQHERIEELEAQLADTREEADGYYAMYQALAEGPL